MNLMQLPDELNSKRQDPEDEYKTKMYQSKSLSWANIRLLWINSPFNQGNGQQVNDSPGHGLSFVNGLLVLEEYWNYILYY